MTDTQTRDPEAIARDIKQTQHEMSQTVDAIGEQLTPRSIFNALLDKFDENDVDARSLLDGARRNPVALGMIAIGGIWLMSDNDSKIPSLGTGSSQRDDGGRDHRSHGMHREYVDHMSAVERADDEDDLAYGRRRDHARANYFMLEREHGEDDGAFRQRLDAATDRIRESRDKVFEMISGAGDSARHMGGTVASKTKSAYQENPIVAGLAAAFAGAVIGAALPTTRTEDEQLGALGAKALGQVADQTRTLGARAKETKDEVLDTAVAAMTPTGGAEGASSSGV